MRHTLFISVIIIAFAGIICADWDPGDPHKMHYPQLPDPTGWDVEFFRVPLADDWQCRQSGPVSDLHLWISWQGDDIGVIDTLNVEIFSDIPDPDNDPYTPETFSKPGEPLWGQKFNSDQFTVRDYGEGEQGFFDPPDSWGLNDHKLYQQINIDKIENPFKQEEGKIYWLAVSADWETGIQAPVGWKTSQDHFNDAAVYWDELNQMWAPLYDPALMQEGIIQPLDLAFVITPEPTTVLLLAAGLIALKRKQY